MSPTIAAAVLATLGSVDPDRVNWEALTPETPLALCVGALHRKPPRSPRRRHRLLPTVSIGLDHRPRSDFRAQRTDEHRLADIVDVDPDDGRHQYDERSMTRWTITLRWNTGSSSPSPVASPTPRRDTQRCRRLLDASAQRPANLADAVDQWVDMAHHRAVLEMQRHREARRD